MNSKWLENMLCVQPSQRPQNLQLLSSTYISQMWEQTPKYSRLSKGLSKDPSCPPGLRHPSQPASQPARLRALPSAPDSPTSLPCSSSKAQVLILPTELSAGPIQEVFQPPESTQAKTCRSPQVLYMHLSKTTTHYSKQDGSSYSLSHSHPLPQGQQGVGGKRAWKAQGKSTVTLHIVSLLC